MVLAHYLLALVMISFQLRLVLVLQDPSPVEVVGFGTTAITTSKLFIQTQELGGDQRTQLNELVVLNDSEEVYLLDYAQMINENTSQSNSPNVGLGTFGADVRSGITSVYFTPVTGVGVTMRVHQVHHRRNCNRYWKHDCITY